MGKLFKTFKLVIYIVALLYILVEGAYYFLDWSVNLGWINILGMAMLVLSVLISFNLRRLIKKPGWAFLFLQLIILSVFGILFSIQRWPGAGIMLTIGMTLLPIFYLVWKFIYHKEFDILSIFKVLFVVTFCVGKLSQLQHWPESNVLQSVSLLVWIVFLSLQIGQLLRPKVEDAVN